ncbi:hypothetical protein ACIA8B_25495 [Micromonospora chalcea]
MDVAAVSQAAQAAEPVQPGDGALIIINGDRHGLFYKSGTARRSLSTSSP